MCLYRNIAKYPLLGKLFSLCMIASLWIILLGQTRVHATEFAPSASSVRVHSPVPSWCEICLHLLTRSRLICSPSVPLKSALNQSMRYLERTASDLPVGQPVQFNLKPTLRFKTNPLFFLQCFLLSRTKFWLLLRQLKLHNMSSPIMQHTLSIG